MSIFDNPQHALVDLMLNAIREITDEFDDCFLGYLVNELAPMNGFSRKMARKELRRLAGNDVIEYHLVESGVSVRLVGGE
jgi:hypothetical protein